LCSKRERSFQSESPTTSPTNVVINSSALVTEIVADQTLLGRFGNDQQQDEIKSGQAGQRALAGDAKDDEQKAINHRGAKDGIHCLSG